MSEQSDPYVLHLFIISTRTGETSVFLLEREPGEVEFPQIGVTQEDLDDEPELLRRIRDATGMDVAISGYLPAEGGDIEPPNSTFLLARALNGSPKPSLPHVGWEWRPGNNLLSLEFLPRVMVDKLRVFMNS